MKLSNKNIKDVINAEVVHLWYLDSVDIYFLNKNFNLKLSN